MRVDLVTFVAEHAQQVGLRGASPEPVNLQEWKSWVDEPVYDRYAGIEVFYSHRGEIGYDGEYGRPGFYWWSCQPGCLPDSDAVGPFETRVEACLDALDGL